METKKYVIEVTEIYDIPVNWASRSAWERQGIFYCKKEAAFYSVNNHSVSYLGKVDFMMESPLTEDKVEENSESEIIPPISESLFLKAIAADSRAEVLR